jgi:hypothetical protein
MSVFRDYDNWLIGPMERGIAEAEAEIEAYDDWCAEQGQEALEDPSEDEGWQLHCQEVNRLIDESQARWEAEMDEQTCSKCGWTGCHEDDCPDCPPEQRSVYELPDDPGSKVWDEDFGSVKA